MTNFSKGDSRTTLWFIGVFLILVTAGVVVTAAMSGGVGAGAGGSAASNFTATTVPAITSADWVRGNKNAKVTLVEYGDFECPACAAYQPMIQQLFSNYGNRVLFVFRNFPLYQIHPDAGISSQAAEAAGLQGKYWEMNSLLYEKQNEWVTAAPADVVGRYFKGYAASLGIDVNRFGNDINSSRVADKIKADVAGGNSAQIDHTPTFFVNLRQIPNPQSYDELKAVVDRALASSTAAL